MGGKALEALTGPKMVRQIRVPFFYGWLLVAVSFVTMAIGVNARTAFSLLFPQILDEFGWDRGVTAGAFSFGFVVSAVVTPCVGWLTDRRGPRLVIETGVFLMGAGLVLATLIREPWQLYLTLGALVGGGVNLLAYTGQSLYLTNWFVRRRGMRGCDGAGDVWPPRCKALRRFSARMVSRPEPANGDRMTAVRSFLATSR